MLTDAGYLHMSLVLAVLPDHTEQPLVCIHNPMLNFYYTRLTASFPGQPGWAGTRKVKPVWI